MSGRGNTTVSSAKSKVNDKQSSRSGRAGLTFPVGRVVSLLFQLSLISITSETLFSIVISNTVTMQNELVMVHQYIWV